MQALARWEELTNNANINLDLRATIGSSSLNYSYDNVVRMPVKVTRERFLHPT